MSCCGSDRKCGTIPNSNLPCEPDADNAACIVDCRLADSHNSNFGAAANVKCRVKRGEEPLQCGRIPASLADSRNCLLDPSTGVCYTSEDGDDCDLQQQAEIDEDDAPLGELGWVSKLLTLWVALAMAAGLLISHFAPVVKDGLVKASIGDTNIVIAVGLIVMLIPPLAKARYNVIASVSFFRKYSRELIVSTIQNWIVGPFMMFLFAWAILHDHPGLMHGTVMVGLARCIAMVIVWNSLAGGNKDLTVLLVAFNSLAQLILFAPYTMFFVVFLGDAVGAPVESISAGDAAQTVAVSVAIYLGIPMLVGFLLWFVLRRWKGEEWYYEKFIPVIDPLALVALLFTIVVLFIIKGEEIIANPLDALLVAAPLVLYFVVMFAGSWIVCTLLGSGYQGTVTLSFTAASNNFELAIAMAIATFGAESDAAFATVIGPLIEVPVMLLFVHVARFFRKRALKAKSDALAVEDSEKGGNGASAERKMSAKTAAREGTAPSSDVLAIGN